MRLAFETTPGTHELVDAGDVYFLEAEGDETIVRLRRRRRFRTSDRLGDLARRLAPAGFLRIHREYVVNLERVRLVRRRADGQDWEVRLEPPVNAVLPVSRGRAGELLARLGMEG